MRVPTLMMMMAVVIFQCILHHSKYHLIITLPTCFCFCLICFPTPTGKKKRKVQPQNNIHKTLKERANESLAPAFFLDILINIF
jgi:hypothetical protein